MNPNGKKLQCFYLHFVFFFVLNLRWISDDCQDMWLWLNPSRQRERFRKDSAAASGKSSVVRVARTKLSGKGSIIQHDDLVPCVTMCCHVLPTCGTVRRFSGILRTSLHNEWWILTSNLNLCAWETAWLYVIKLFCYIMACLTSKQFSQGKERYEQGKLRSLQPNAGELGEEARV